MKLLTLALALLLGATDAINMHSHKASPKDSSSVS